jgi:uncharacterized coiled-coil DUF342 family protein
MPYNEDDIATPPSSMSDPIDILISEVRALREEVAEIHREHTETVEQIDGMIKKLEPHIETIGPMIDQLSSHPLLRMLGAGSKKEKG